MEITMYDNLLLLPLFQGLSKNDITSIIEKVKLHFQQYKEGETFIRQGDTCDKLCFLLKGKTIAQRQDLEHNYTLTEVLDEPYIIEPYSLFGMNTCYTATYRAQTAVHVLTIDKSFFFTELNKYEIFCLNLLNMLSNRCQRTNDRLWNTHIGELNEKFVNFISLRSQIQTGEKMLFVTMEDLANLINETRINLSRLLNELQDKGLVQLKRKEIYIPSFEKLKTALS